MVCYEANEACSFIPGADIRVPIPYENPKVADNIDQETIRYDERSRHIAAKMFYMMWFVKNAGG